MNLPSAYSKKSAFPLGVASFFKKLQHAAPAVELPPSRLARRLELVHADEERHDDPAFRQVAFTMSVISLSAKLSRVDGKVTMEEFLAFRELFPMQDHLSSKIRDLFMAACDDSISYEHHARQIHLLFPGRERLLAELLDRLFRIAVSDGAINMRERDYLARVNHILGFSKQSFNRMMSRHAAPASVDPYKVMGVTPKASNDELKRTYRRLMREYHPDGLQAYGVSQELVALSQKKVVAINEAYDLIQRKRGIKRRTI